MYDAAAPFLAASQRTDAVMAPYVSREMERSSVRVIYRRRSDIKAAHVCFIPQQGTDLMAN